MVNNSPAGLNNFSPLQSILLYYGTDIHPVWSQFHNCLHCKTRNVSNMENVLIQSFVAFIFSGCKSSCLSLSLLSHPFCSCLALELLKVFFLCCLSLCLPLSFLAFLSPPLPLSFSVSLIPLFIYRRSRRLMRATFTKRSPPDPTHYLPLAVTFPNK